VLPINPSVPKLSLTPLNEFESDLVYDAYTEQYFHCFNSVQMYQKRLQAAEMKFMRKTAGLTLWNHKRNEEI
jgi:hypothetical protein